MLQSYALEVRVWVREHQVINTYIDFWILSKAADAGRKSSTATSLFSFFLSVFLSVKETFYNRRALEKEDKDNP